MDQQDRPGWSVPAPGPETTPLSTPDVVSSRPRRFRIGTTIAVAAVAIGGLGVVGTAYAASNSTPSPTPSNGTQGYGYGMGGSGMGDRHGYGMPGGAPSGAPQGDRDGDGGVGRHGMGGPGMGPGMRGAGAPIHGTFVAPKQGGGYQTVQMQHGTVTAVTATSVEVKSEDGFTATYVVNASTDVNRKAGAIATVKVGDDVLVMGTEVSGTVTATQIMDRTQFSGGMKGWNQPKPSASASSGSTA